MLINRAWNHNIHYHPLVFRAIPAGCGRALDVGCGQGCLARSLAKQCEAVVAIDLDHHALTQAKAACLSADRITFVEGDVMTYPLPDESFDFITVVATLHHLPLKPAIDRLRNLLRPGGTLAIVGLYVAKTPTDYLTSAIALAVSHVLRRIYRHEEIGAPLQDPAETLAGLRTTFNEMLPGSVLKRHLFFRYSLVWHKI